MLKFALPEVRLAALEKEIRAWLRLDVEISSRLKQPNGWTPSQIKVHGDDLREREAVRERLQLLIADRPTQETEAAPDAPESAPVRRCARCKTLLHHLNTSDTCADCSL